MTKRRLILNRKESVRLPNLFDTTQNISDKNKNLLELGSLVSFHWIIRDAKAIAHFLLLRLLLSFHPERMDGKEEEKKIIM